MTPEPTDRLKVFIWKDSTGEDVPEITNDAGDPAEEFSILETLDLATAERLVLCWNACRGVPDSELRTRSDSCPAN